MTINDIFDWLYLRFVSPNSALAGISKAVQKLEKDIDVRTRHAQKATANADKTIKAAQAKAATLNASASQHTAIAETQIRRRDKVKAAFEL